MMKILSETFPAAYQTLYEAKPIRCSVTGTVFDAVPAPCAAVLDVSQSIDMLYATVDGESQLLMIVFFLLLVLCLSSIACC